MDIEKNECEDPIYVQIAKPRLVNHIDRGYKEERDHDFNLSSESHELLDTIKYPSIEEQVLAFTTQGVKLDLGNYEEDIPVDDDKIDDIDELATILDNPDCSRQDFDMAVERLRQKRFSTPKKKKEQVKDPDPGEKLDFGEKPDPGEKT